MTYVEGSPDVEPSFGTQTGSSVRGAFTFALVMLQERLAHLPDNENRLLLPIIEKLDWRSSHVFWRGTITNEVGDAISTSVYAPCRATSRILLHVVVHWRDLGISREARSGVEVGVTDIIELAKLVSGPARVAFTKEEQIHIRNRLKHLTKGDKPNKSLSSPEQHIVKLVSNMIV